jgi:hypothetical protein
MCFLVDNQEFTRFASLLINCVDHPMTGALQATMVPQP